MAKFRDVLNFYRPYWPVTLFSVVAVSSLEIAELVVPYAVGQILNILSGQALDPAVQSLSDAIAARAQLDPDKGLTLGVLLGMIFVVTVVRAPIQPWVGGWFHWDVAFRARRDNLQKAHEKLLTLPLEFFDENNSGRLMGLISRGISNHTWTYPEIVGLLIPKLIRVLGIFGIILFIEWRIAVLFLFSFVVILVFSFRKLKQLIGMEALVDRYYEQTESRTSEIITNIKTVKAFATEAQELTRQNRRFEREFKVLDYRVHRGYVKLGVWQTSTVQVCVFSVLAFTLYATLQGQISLGHFVTTYTVASIAYSEVTPIAELAEIFARRFTSMMRFHEFMQKPAGVDAVTLVPTQEPPYTFTGKLELAGVSFGYDPKRPVLQDISLLIEPYQTIALVGRSGSGKSTLVKLLFRYFEPNQGTILMDGHDIRALDVSRYRRRLAIVHQEVDVFNGTLLNNLTYGNSEATFEQVEEACRIARVDEFVRQLPEGYYTVVGERGLRLSGGQRQRLGIARALIAEPDVLVFDEATSSLDYESERAIQLAMRSILGTRTTIIIAHRLSTVREADKIVVLDGGRIAEVGSHRELLERGGLYQRLHALQETGDLLL
ncbi:MAG: ABC transporter ATP-binding protein [Gemmatimonadaceae bacterium]|nr:ABC transporter ATP-binding protein [Gloeobacterales cyanobacterium ES-bin-141]